MAVTESAMRMKSKTPGPRRKMKTSTTGGKDRPPSASAVPSQRAKAPKAVRAKPASPSPTISNSSSPRAQHRSPTPSKRPGRAPGKASTGKPAKAPRAVSETKKAAKSLGSKPITAKPRKKKAEAEPAVDQTQAPASANMLVDPVPVPREEAPAAVISSAHPVAQKELPSAEPAEAFRLPIPPILLEGDDPTNPPEPTAPPPPPAVEAREVATIKAEHIPPLLGPEPVEAPTPAPQAPVVLASAPSPEPLCPESLPVLPLFYGTRHLTLAPRDAHWLHAFWDLSPAEEHQLRSQASEGALWLRVFLTRDLRTPVACIQLDADARCWFVEVPEAGAEYCATLGYPRPGGAWEDFLTSASVITPSEAPAAPGQAQFVSIPIDLPLAQLREAVAEPQNEAAPIVQALADLPPSRRESLPAGVMVTYPEWKPEEAQALKEVIWSDTTQQVWLNSAQMAEQARQPIELGRGVSSVELAVPAIGERMPTGMGAVSSEQVPAPAGRKGFWFNVNAELIVYGATEADAAVWLGDRRVPLRPDGSFTLRFSLPDGGYELPMVAVSADGSDSRGARLKFRRQTDYRGKVEWHPQDPALKSPKPEHLEAGLHSGRHAKVSG